MIQSRTGKDSKILTLLGERSKYIKLLSNTVAHKRKKPWIQELNVILFNLITRSQFK